MLATQRRQRILDEVRRAGAARVSDLTALLGVSDMTVRRDLDQLGQQGLLAKVHGGATAVPMPQSGEEPGFDAKSLLHLEAKHAIAAAAVRLVEPGSAVALGAGTTTWVLAQHLREVPDLTVVTNSVKIAGVLDAQHTVILTGGVRTPSDALVGPVADLVLRSLHVDVVFLGCHGIARGGLTTPNLLEAETNRALVRMGEQLVVVADSTKWGTAGLMTFAALSDVHVLVTDERLATDATSLLRQQVRRLEVVAL